MTTPASPQSVSHFAWQVCPHCGGSACQSCGLVGMRGWYAPPAHSDEPAPQPHSVVWSLPLDWPHIAARQFARTAEKVFLYACLGIGVLGFLAGLWVYGLPVLEGKVLTVTLLPLHWSFVGWRKVTGDWRAVLFWVSLALDCFAYYRLTITASRRQSVVKKVFTNHEEKGVPVTSPDWAVLVVDTNSLAIDASFTQGAVEAIERAWRLAKNWGHGEVNAIHLLASILTMESASTLFGRLGTDWDALAAGVKKALAAFPRSGGEPIPSRELWQIIYGAYEEAYQNRRVQVSEGELLVVLDRQKGAAADLLYDVAIEPDTLTNVVLWLQINEQLREQWRHHHRLGRLRPKGDVNKAYTAVMTPLLDAFSTDLTRQAVWGAFPPLVGRERELAEVFRIIQGNHSGALLVGQPGVGKTTLVEGIAERMIADDVPPLLRDKRLVSVSIPKLLAGNGAAQANERLLRMFSEVARAGNVILVFENIHTLIGVSTGSEQSLDLAEALESYITKTGAVVLATTTPVDFRQLENHSPLVGALPVVTVAEPLGNHAIQMLESRVGFIEGEHRIGFSYAAIAAAVDLSNRYLHDQYLPRKALEILRETAVTVAGQAGRSRLVTAEDVAAVVSDKTHIPLTKITETESEKLTNLETVMHQRLVGQDEAVRAVAASLRRARAGLRDAKRPIANFLFLGPTGVGKTELAKTIAEVYFGNETSMVRLDMSEYQTAESIYRLIGTPDGATSGYLTEAIRRTPFTLLLCDEIEKAHADILNLFLQVMDDGRLTDASGRTVDFTNSIIIMTSNAGTDYIQSAIRAGQALNAIRTELVTNKLGQYFRPEFLNRFDAINVFAPLSPADVLAVAKRMIARITAALEASDGVTLQVTEAAIQELATAGFDPQFGARPLRRVVQDRVEDTLANLKIQNQLVRGVTVVLDAGGAVTVQPSRRS